MNAALFTLTLAAALGSGAMGGVFFAFSAFVMKALHRLPAEQGIAAMQSINVMAVTRVFMTALFGTAVTAVAVAVLALADWHGAYGPYLVAGSALYLVGVVGLTIGYHVPRNDALAKVDPHSHEAAGHWDRYFVQWTAMNHVRAVAPLVAAAGFTVALHVG